MKEKEKTLLEFKDFLLIHPVSTKIKSIGQSSPYYVELTFENEFCLSIENGHMSLSNETESINFIFKYQNSFIRSIFNRKYTFEKSAYLLEVLLENINKLKIEHLKNYRNILIDKFNLQHFDSVFYHLDSNHKSFIEDELSLVFKDGNFQNCFKIILRNYEDLIFYLSFERTMQLSSVEEILSNLNELSL